MGVRGRAGRKGLRRRSRVRVRPHRDRPGVRGKGPAGRPAGEIPNFLLLPSLSPSRDAGLRVAEEPRAPRGLKWDWGRPARVLPAEKARRPPPSSARARAHPHALGFVPSSPASRVAPVTPCLAAGAASGFPGRRSPAPLPTPPLFSGLTDSRVSRRSGKLWATAAQASY